MLQAYNLELSDTARLSDVMLNTSRLTGMSLDEQGTIAGRLAARLGDARPEIEDVSFALALAAEAGLRGTRAMLPLMNLLDEIQRPTGATKEAFQKLGVELQDSEGKTRNLRELLPELGRAMDGLTDAEKRRLAVMLAGKDSAEIFISMLRQGKDHGDKLAASISELGSTMDRAKAQTDGLAERLGGLGVQAKTAGQLIGGDLAKGILFAADRYGDFGKTIDGLPAAAKMALGLIPPVGLALGVQGDLKGRMGQLALEQGAADRLAAGLGAGGLGPPLTPPPPRTTSTGLDFAPIATAFEAQSGRGLSDYQQRFGSATAGLAQTFHAGMADLAKATDRDIEGLEKSLSASLGSALDGVKQRMIAEKIPGWQEIGAEGERLIAAALREPSAESAAAVDGWFARVAQLLPDKEAQKRVAKTALDGFHEGLTAALASSQADLGEIGGRAMAAVNEGVATNAEGAGKAAITAVQALVSRLREVGDGEWQAVHDRLAGAMERAFREKTPGALQALREELRQANQELQNSEFEAAWTKAVDAKNEKLADAERTRREKEEAAEEDHQTKMAELVEDRDWRKMVDSARAAVDELIRVYQYDEESVRLSEQRKREERDRTISDERSAADRTLRSSRDVFEQALRQGREQRDTQRQNMQAIADAQTEHQRRVNEIQQRGGPNMAQALADENRSFAQRQADVAGQAARQQAELQIRRQDEAQDRARRQAEETADRARKAGEDAADRTRREGYQDQDRQKAMTSADALKSYRQQQEEAFAISKEQIEAREWLKQIGRVDATYTHAIEQADKAAISAGESYYRELSKALDALAEKFPGVDTSGHRAQLQPTTTSGGGEEGEEEGYATGGSFIVAGSGGTDSQQVRFRATPGERITISPPMATSGAFVGLHRDATGAALGVNSDLLTRSLLEAGLPNPERPFGFQTSAVAGAPRDYAGLLGAAVLGAPRPSATDPMGANRPAAGAESPAAAAGDVYNLAFTFNVGDLVGEGGMEELSRKVFHIAKKELRGSVLLAGATARH